MEAGIAWLYGAHGIQVLPDKNDGMCRVCGSDDMVCRAEPGHPMMCIDCGEKYDAAGKLESFVIPFSTPAPSTASEIIFTKLGKTEAYHLHSATIRNNVHAIQYENERLDDVIEKVWSMVIAAYNEALKGTNGSFFIIIPSELENARVIDALFDRCEDGWSVHPEHLCEGGMKVTFHH